MSISVAHWQLVHLNRTFIIYQTPESWPTVQKYSSGNECACNTMTVYLSLVTHKKYRYDRPDSFQWLGGGGSPGFVTTEFCDYREKKNSAKGEVENDGCQLQRKSNLCMEKMEKKMRDTIHYFLMHVVSHQYIVVHIQSQMIGLPASRILLYPNVQWQ